MALLPQSSQPEVGVRRTVGQPIMHTDTPTRLDFIFVSSGPQLLEGLVSQLLEPTSRTQEDAGRLPVHYRSDNRGKAVWHHILSKRFLSQQVTSSLHTHNSRSFISVLAVNCTDKQVWVWLWIIFSSVFISGPQRMCLILVLHSLPQCVTVSQMCSVTSARPSNKLLLHSKIGNIITYAQRKHQYHNMNR